MHRNEPILTFSGARELEAHLCAASCASGGGAAFWLKLAKVGAPVATLGKEQAIEVALCCGWIDGQLARLDEHHFLVRMTPRRPGSPWSANNRATAERLAQAGRLRPAGLAAIEAAKADGRWDAAYASQATAQVPEDLAFALASNAAARRFFETLDRANRYAIIYRVHQARRAETRARRIANFVDMLARGEAIHPIRTPKAATKPGPGGVLK